MSTISSRSSTGRLDIDEGDILYVHGLFRFIEKIEVMFLEVCATVKAKPATKGVPVSVLLNNAGNTSIAGSVPAVQNI